MKCDSDGALSSKAMAFSPASEGTLDASALGNWKSLLLGVLGVTFRIFQARNEILDEEDEGFTETAMVDGD